MNDHPSSDGTRTCAAAADQRGILIEDIATLIFLQHRRQQRHALGHEGQQRQVPSAEAKESTKRRQNK